MICFDKKTFSFHWIDSSSNFSPADLFSTETYEIPLIQLSAPLVVGIPITNRCNLRCHYCFARNSLHKADFNHKLLPKLIERLSQANVKVVWISGGEPFLHPEIKFILSSIFESGISIAVDTNGTLIDSQDLKFLAEHRIHLRISLDGACAEFNNQCRSEFSATWRSLIMAQNADVSIGVMTVLHRKNIEGLLELGEKLVEMNIPRWTLLQLNQSFAPTDLHLDQSQLQQILNSIRIHLWTNHPYTTVVLSDQGRATLLVGANGEYLIPNLTNGSADVHGSIHDMSISEVWNVGMDLSSHLTKYLGIGLHLLLLEK